VLSLLAQLPIEEPERGDPEFARRPKQALPGSFPRGGVFKSRLFESCQRIPNMWRIVDGQAATAFGIDIREGAVR
jgi:hypothetical protein